VGNREDLFVGEEDEINSALWKLSQQLFGAIKPGSAVSHHQLLCSALLYAFQS